MRDIKNVYTTSPLLVGRDRACVLPCQFTIEMGLKWQPQQTAATGRHSVTPRIPRTKKNYPTVHALKTEKQTRRRIEPVQQQKQQQRQQHFRFIIIRFQLPRPFPCIHYKLHHPDRDRRIRL